MVYLSIFRFKQSILREASTFLNREGKEVNVAQHYLAEVEYANKQYSKIAKTQIIKLGSKEIKGDCELPSTGDWLCEVEQKGDDFKVIRVLAKADLNTLLVKSGTNQSRKEAKGDIL